ncbi:MAG: peptidase [Firmicutes bacterium HGW-Firmicutes-21]|nr:MAG: peptidase [Firmicutes bacterium HGW-Firmicutes-21]
MFLDPTYLLYMAPVLLLSLWAQFRVSSSFKKYSKVASKRGMTGAEAARLILDQNGLRDVPVERIAGKLTDHFDPRTNVIRLSEPVYDSNSIAAIGIAAHEAGHAVQHKTGYVFIKVRAAIIPVCNVGSQIAPLLIIFGLWMSMFQLYWAGILLFGTVAFFQLITLPVEFNASRRAITILRSYRTLDLKELSGAKKVLSAAALTYVAALLTSMMQIFYFISLGNRRR